MAASATAAAAGNRDADCDAGSVVSSAQEVEVMSAPQNVLGLGIQKTLRKWQKPGGGCGRFTGGFWLLVMGCSKLPLAWKCCRPFSRWA